MRKQCTKCKKEKSYSEFFKDKRAKNGVYSACNFLPKCPSSKPQEREWGKQAGRQTPLQRESKVVANWI